MAQTTAPEPLDHPTTSVPALLAWRVAETPDRPAYKFPLTGADGADTWQTITWAQAGERVRAIAAGLLSLGIGREQRVGILSSTRVEWVLCDLGILSAGGATTTVYPSSTAEETAYILADSDSRVCIVEDVAQLEKLRSQREHLPQLTKVVVIDSAARAGASGGAAPYRGGDGWELSLAELEALGREHLAKSPRAIDDVVAGIRGEELATLIYTSGTTGPPKGVMLSHRNLAWTARAMVDLGNGRETDCTLSYLPLSHIAEQMATIHMPATTGASTYYAESIDKVPDNLKEVQPTIFFGVPRIWEKFHAGVSGKMREATGAKKALVDWTRKVCTEVNALRMRGRSPGKVLELQYKLADKLVLSKLKPALGLGRARNCISGAAPIAKDVLEFFASIDIIVQEIYGQSEDNGPTSFNLPGRTKLGTVGVALPGVQVKIAEDGEILVKGPNVFMGYYKEPAATAETLIDGWLHSGDLGAFDADGFLSITGRKKEIIITAGGKNIAPKNIEAAIKESPLVSEAVVIGDRRKFLVALVTLDDAAVEAWMKGRGLAGTPHDSVEVVAEVQRVIDDVNTKLARVEQVKKFKILPRQFGIDTGELTPTLKIKRKVVNQNFAAEIESLYAE